MTPADNIPAGGYRKTLKSKAIKKSSEDNDKKNDNISSCGCGGNINMTIKSSKTNTNILLFTLCLLIMLAIILYIEIGNIYLLLFLIFLVFFLLIPPYIALGRTFVMDETGCTVRLLKYSRKYKWDEFEVKRIETLRDGFGSHRGYYQYSACAIFSPRKDRKPKWLMPADYSVFFRPLSFIFVYFKSEKPLSKGELAYPDIYAVDKDLFMSKMAEWNVELEYRR